jgi:hypothetical protein
MVVTILRLLPSSGAAWAEDSLCEPQAERQRMIIAEIRNIDIVFFILIFTFVLLV